MLNPFSKYKKVPLNPPESNPSIQSWPELVGRPWKEAEETIRREYPNASIQVLPENTNVGKGNNPDRVRIIVTGDGMVSKPPVIGS